ncbi:MAG TPA: methionyl-tRNA formyltransferase [Patescibacteria group bacterium]|nr:methionyl-tRNA formyltransferase [Patescibacteria group bacterium]
MVNSNYKIVFFGSGPYVSRIIEIIKNNFDVVRVVSSHEKLDKQLTEELNSYNVQVAVLASFGKIISNEVLNLFPLGIINIHPSLLPEYRGPTPVQTALLDGKEKTGVSIMKIDNEVDHGPILAQAEYKIEEKDTTESLYNKLFEIGANLLVDILPKYISGDLKPIDQNHSKATYTANQLSRESGFIDLNNEPLTMNYQLNNMIHAYYPWPGVWFKAAINGKEKIVKLFPEGKIQVEGKNIMNLKDFANGYPEGKEIITKLGLN